MISIFQRTSGNRRTRRSNNQRVPTIETLEPKRLLTVFGIDTRYPVPEGAIISPPRTDYRNFAAVGQVIANYPGEQRSSICSGVLISPSVVLTNAHCVVKETPNLQPRYPANIAFYPGRHRDDSSPYGVATATASQLRISPEYLRTLGSVDVFDDYALIMLSTDIGRLTGWMDIEAYEPNFFNGRMLVSAGYPGDRRDPVTGVYAMHVTAGPSESAGVFGNYGTLNFAGRDYTDRAYSHPYNSFSPKCKSAVSIIDAIRCLDSTSGFDIIGGQSGSPIWYVDVQGVGQVTNRVVGLVTASNDQKNFGMRITPYVYNQIVGWMGQLTTFPKNVVYNQVTGIEIAESPNFKADLTDFDRYFETQYNRLGETNVRRGDKVNYNVRAYNAGTANLPEGAFLRVFASLDGILSEDDQEVSVSQVPNLERFKFADIAGDIRTQNLQAGNYKLLWKWETGRHYDESDVENNTGEFRENLVISVESPVYDVTPNQVEIDELDQWVYQIRAFAPQQPSFHRINLSAVGLPIGATFSHEASADGAVLGTLIWSPAEHQDGTFEIVFEAEFDGVPDTNVKNTITVVVREVNSAPTVAPLADQTIFSGELFEAEIFIEDPDEPSDQTTATVHHDELPGSATFDPQSRRFRWIPSSSDIGSVDVKFWAKDSGGLESARISFRITVLDRNIPPEVRFESVPINENDFGAVVGYLDVYDANLGQSFDVTIDDPRFELDGRALRLRAGIALDYESASTLTVGITVTDHGTPPLTTKSTILLHVTNQIDPPKVQVDFDEELQEKIAGLFVGWLSIDYERGTDKLQLSVSYHDDKTLILGPSGEMRLSSHDYFIGEELALQIIVNDLDSLTQYSYTINAPVKPNPSPWRNSQRSLDVNQDLRVSPVDALLIIDELNFRGRPFLPQARPFDTLRFLDTNGDNRLSPSDALLIIDQLNDRSSHVSGEGELKSAEITPVSALSELQLQTNLTNASFDAVYLDYEDVLDPNLRDKRRNKSF